VKRLPNFCSMRATACCVATFVPLPLSDRSVRDKFDKLSSTPPKRVLERNLLKMQYILSIASLLACLMSAVSATALTYRMQPHEKACFFNWVDVKGAKVAFYFAVSNPQHFKSHGHDLYMNSH
jgi:hypothetical protein